MLCYTERCFCYLAHLLYINGVDKIIETPQFSSTTNYIFQNDHKVESISVISDVIMCETAFEFVISQISCTKTSHVGFFTFRNMKPAFVVSFFIEKQN